MKNHQMPSPRQMAGLLLLAALWALGLPAAVAELAPRQTVQKGSLKVASNAADFSSNDGIAIFKGNVVVVHPGFTMTCDKLVVYWTEDATGVDRAVATGYVVICKTPDFAAPKPEYVSAKSRHAVFTGRDQNLTLTDWPQVQKDDSLLKATERGAIMILRPDGTLETDGGSFLNTPLHTLNNEAK